MKKTVLIFLLISVYNFLICQDLNSVEGSWQGEISVQNINTTLVLDIYPNSSSKIIASLPKMASINHKASKIKFTEGTLSFNVVNLAYSFDLTLKNDSLHGFAQGMRSKKIEHISLFKTENPLRVNRPQTPKPPFSYKEEIIVVKNKKAKISLEGTLTIPSGEGPFPTVILVTGSGPQDRDSEVFMHKIFWVIADYLSSRGVAVFRYDERGVGKSTGNFAQATSFDFAQDLSYIFKQIKKHPKVGKLGVLGHSEGGLVAAIVASKNKKCDFVISLAGPAVNGKEILLEQAKQMYILEGKDKNFLNFEIEVRSYIFELYGKSKDATSFAQDLRAYFEKLQSEISQEKAKRHNISPKVAEVWILQLSSAWMKEYIKTDPYKYWRKLKCPTLVLIGDKDFQVPYHQNMPIYEKAFKEAKNSNANMMKIKSANHLFQICEKGSMDEYASIEESISPKVLEIISNWIKQTTNRDEK